jgi:hypothetical protein
MSIYDQIKAIDVKADLVTFYRAEVKPFKLRRDAIIARNDQIASLTSDNAGDTNALAGFGDIDAVMDALYLQLGRIEGADL